MYASSQPDASAHLDAQSYVALVDTYRSGRTADARSRAVDFDLATAAALVAVAERSAKRGDVSNPDERAFFRAAAMLHTDAAADLWSSGADRRASNQIALAERWVNVSEPDGSPPLSFRRRWHLAAGLLVAASVAPEDALKYFERLCSRLSDDAPLLTAAGWSAERLATGRPAVGRSTLGAAQSTKSAILRRAQRLLSAALAADQAAVEAALRLARVRLLLGDAVEARSLLENLVRIPVLPPSEAYVARLLLASVWERSGDLDRAAALYREAAAVAPPGQSARLALAHLLYRAGRRRAAAEIAEDVATGRWVDTDPWPVYLLGDIPRGERLRGELRQEVQR